MTAQSLLIDVSVSNTAPGASDVFNYKIRYRCASITEHCYNSTITYTIPDALEIISAPSPGGNITNVAVSGNTVTVSLASPPSAGAPAGALAAGSSGLFLTGVRFKCGTNGTPPVPAAGMPVNFTPAGLPVFSASAMSVTAAAPANVTTPTVSACVPPPGPIPPPTDLIKLIQNGVGGGSDVRGVVMPGENTYYYLNIPTHNASTVFTDMFPTGFHLVETSADFPNFFTGTGYKLEVFSNGTWWEITNGVLNRTYKGYQYWLGDFATGAPLLDDFGNDIGSTKMTKTFFNGSTSSWGSNITGFRITTGNTGLNPGLNTYFSFHVEDNVASGDYENCISSSDPAFLTSCAIASVGPQKPRLNAVAKWSPNNGAIYWPPSANLGTTTIVNSGPSQWYFPSFPTTKDAKDIVWGIRVQNDRSNPEPLDGGFIIEDLLPAGFDYVSTGDVPNWWAADYSFGSSTYLNATCKTPSFTVIPNYSGGRTLLRWTFPPTCVFPADGNNTNTTTASAGEIVLAVSSRWAATSPLPPSVVNDFSVKTADGSPLAVFVGPVATGHWACQTSVSSNPSTVTFPTSGANTDSKKYVKGALDSDFSRFPLVGNTNLNGDGEYEIYIENTGFDPIQQLDVADVLPYIGDMSLTATGSRGSQWSEELANAITIERYTIGSGWSTVPAGQLPLGVMYANTYNACYLDGALPAGQITADPAIASEGQAAGCTDMSTANPAAGAKGFAFRWLNTTTPLTFGEQLRVKINVRQLTGEADYTNGEIAWNSLAYTATAVSTGALLSSEPIKVGLKMIDPATTAAIGDYVWLDGNANGRQDAGETPVEGVRVSLYDAAGQPVIIPNSGGQQAVTTTNANGYYCFPGLTPNTTYYVRLDHAADYNSGAPLSGYTLTTANAVADDVDSDAAMGTLAGAATPRPQITSPTLGPGTQTKTYDFGFVCLGSVSGYVWMDTDLSGSQDPGEMAQSGVTVTLRDAVTNAAVGAAQMTNAGGLYSFTSVPAGVYYVEFSGFPGGKIPTFKDLTGNDADDSDANPNGQTDIFPVSSCGSADMDLGLRLPPVNPATICGTAWDDLNKDGAFQVTEPGMPSVTVQLLDVNGFTLNSVTTDVNGNYCFTNLDPNVSYKVAFVPPAVNIMFSVAGPDQDVDLMTGVTTATYTPTNNQTINDVDAGFMGPLSIGNQVWSDANNNGLFDNGEAIFSGLEVRLIASDGTTVLATTTTDGNGRYVFKNLNAGTYYVEVESPAGFLSSADIATTNTPNSTDSDDNGAGTAMSGYIRSTAVTLANDGGIPGSANWTEADHGLPINGMIDPASNAKAYYTVDFGFYPLPLCVQPTDVTFTQMAPGCLGAMPLNNGTISLATVTDGTNYGVSTLNAGTYDGPVYPATAIPGTLPAVIQSMVPNTGGTYIVRVFNGAADCYTDVPVVVAPVTCNCPTIPCGTTTVIKN